MAHRWDVGLWSARPCLVSFRNAESNVSKCWIQKVFLVVPDQVLHQTDLLQFSLGRGRTSMVGTGLSSGSVSLFPQILKLTSCGKKSHDIVSSLQCSRKMQDQPPKVHTFNWKTFTFWLSPGWYTHCSCIFRRFFSPFPGHSTHLSTCGGGYPRYFFQHPIPSSRHPEYFVSCCNDRIHPFPKRNTKWPRHLQFVVVWSQAGVINFSQYGVSNSWWSISCTGFLVCTTWFALKKTGTSDLWQV